MTELIVVGDQDGIRSIRMNRPEKKNALVGVMYDMMARAIETAQNDDTIRCLLIAGAPNAFTAGNDINEFMQAALQGGASARPAMPLLHALARNRKPMVAAVQGVAVGIGTTLLLHCDQVVAATDAKLSTPFISLGVLPEAASSLLAPRLLGHQRAFSLLVMGRPLDAEEARQWGIVSTVVDAERVESEARKVAEAIAALPAEGVMIARRLMRGPPDDIVARIDQEAELFRQRLGSPEAKAAFLAFINRKR